MICNQQRSESDTKTEEVESETIETNQRYEIDQDGRMIAEGVAVHREVGDSEFDYVLVGSDPDQNDTSELNAFGFHGDELAPLPLPVDDNHD